MTNQLDHEHMLTVIRQRQEKYAAIFNLCAWSPDELSNIGWLGLVGVPWLLNEVEDNRENSGKNRNTDCQPGPGCVWPLEPALKLMLPEQAMANTALVVPTGNPLAKFLVGFLAKAVGVSFVAHMVERSNVEVTGAARLFRAASVWTAGLAHGLTEHIWLREPYIRPK